MVEAEPDSHFPGDFATIRFHNQDGSKRIFAMLHSMSSGLGDWKVLDTIGRPWIELPETLRHDLMTWRWLYGIGDRQKQKMREGKMAIGS